MYTMHAMIFNAGVPSYYYGILTVVIHCWFRMRGCKLLLKENSISLNEKKLA